MRGTLDLAEFKDSAFKYGDSFSKFCLKKQHKISHFWSLILSVPVLHEILNLDEFEGADFKYDNIFFLKFTLELHIKGIFVPNFEVLCMKVYILKNLRLLISNMTSFSNYNIKITK